MATRSVFTKTVTRIGGNRVVEHITYSVGAGGGIQTTIGTEFVATLSPSSSTSSSTTPKSSASTPSAPGSSSSTSSTAPAGSGSAQSPSPTPSGGGSGISTGALAGAAVGCLIGGALIAFLLAFFIFKSREKRKFNSGAYSQNSGSSSQDKDVVPLTELPASKSTGAAATGWRAFLPQSADDRTIHNGVKTFFSLIELHVDNFYRRTPVELNKDTREALAQIDSGKLPGRIDQLMQDQRLILPVIKHCIADLLITRMSPLTFPETSLLPSNLSAIPTKLTSSSLSSNERNAAGQAYSQWRLLNAYLYPRPEENQIYIDDREAKANDIAELLSKAFAPWQSGGDDKSDMHEHEKGLVATAGNLGILLMSQPSAFEFKWTGDSGRATSGRSLISMPGFWKTTDEQGRQLTQAQLLVSPVIIRV